MKLDDMIRRFRLVADDAASPYLWGDEELAEYANEAVKQAAERAYLIPDTSTPAVTRLPVSAGRAVYPVDPSIIWINGVFNLDTNTRLTPASVRDFDASRRWEDDEGDPRCFMWQVREIRIYPKPTQDAELRLSVYRLPRDSMGKNDEPEIPTRFHEDLVEWMLYRAYSKRDSETYDDQRAGRAYAAFVSVFGDKPDADTWRQQQEKRAPVARINPEWGRGPVNYGERSRIVRRNRQ